MSTSWPSRVARHVRLSRKADADAPIGSPPFLIVFINSVCNLACEHCFYWKSLNRPDDLEYADFDRLTSELGPIENLNVSGGEPFLRPDFAEIVGLFIRRNGARNVYVPTNGWFTEKTVAAVEGVLGESTLDRIVIELSLDGLPERHDRFRGRDGSFAKAMETHDALAKLQRVDPRLRIHAITTVTSDNLPDVIPLTEYLHRRCEAMEHHNLAIIRGDRLNPSLTGPDRTAYDVAWRKLRAVWSDRESGRFGGIVDPMLHHAKLKTLEARAQVVPCTAGRMTGVVHANGDIGLCETLPTVGNIRKDGGFRNVWFGEAAEAQRASIARKECWCTNEVFLWPSFTFSPKHLASTFIGSRAWSV